ncbi:MAG: hypothetical protein B7Y23_02830 [Sulfurovum sp. 16-42-52]|jgi:hypothetical protein|nr:MAG: hypothetical protein B7Y23_02830 [Sulfurovum sp. 16-42-52]OZA46179.1 MAG: hypothetical protein B7X80_03260 [Sulfurovum sp. 17-42-90]
MIYRLLILLALLTINAQADDYYKNITDEALSEMMQDKSIPKETKKGIVKEFSRRSLQNIKVAVDDYKKAKQKREATQKEYEEAVKKHEALVKQEAIKQELLAAQEEAVKQGFLKKLDAHYRQQHLEEQQQQNSQLRYNRVSSHSYDEANNAIAELDMEQRLNRQEQEFNDHKAEQARQRATDKQNEIFDNAMEHIHGDSYRKGY